VLQFHSLDLKRKQYQLMNQDVQICVSGVEMVGRNKREMSAMVLNYFYAVGEAAVALVAWLSKSWVVIQVAVSPPPAVFILYDW
jgi:OCT family organic cation transporter-like MFS transporter 4/5